jgi:hypothetical protein
MPYCPHCGEKQPEPEVKKPLQPGLPIPPCDIPAPAPILPSPFVPYPRISWSYNS